MIVSIHLFTVKVGNARSDSPGTRIPLFFDKLDELNLSFRRSTSRYLGKRALRLSAVR